MNDNQEVNIKEKLIKRLIKIGIILCVLAIIEQLIIMPKIESLICITVLLISLLIALFFSEKMDNVKWAENIVGVTAIFFVFPFIYFTSGGIRGGAAIWFVIGIFYVIGLYDGIRMYLFLLLTITSFVTTYLMGYYHPELVINLENEKAIITDSLFAVIIVGILLGGITKFQLKSYDQARKYALNQRDEIEEISKKRSFFFANISHEIISPINSIIGLNEMILREPNISDEVLVDADNIRNTSKLLLSLVNDLFDLSRIINNMMVLNPVTYSTEEMFSDLVDMFRFPIEDKNLDFYVEIDKDMPSLLKGDVKRIKQILTNLLSNAQKYTKEGNIILSAKAEIIDELICRLTISVEDTGIGIKTESMEHIFDSFTEYDDNNSNMIEGIGLGLSISKQLAELMEGELTVDSIYTQGSKFTLILYQPIVDRVPIGTIDFKSKQRKDRLLYQQLFEAPDARILIIDDNENNKIVCSKLLRNTKIKIDTVKNQRELLEATLRKYYHVILVDDSIIQLHEDEFCDAIRCQKNGLCRDTPIVVFSSENNEKNFNKYEQYGFSGFVEKPINGVQLESILLSLLPEEMIEYSNIDENRVVKSLTGDILVKNVSKKKRLIITTECVCDLPEKDAKQLGVELVYLYVNTPVGRFKDTLEMDVDNYADLLNHGEREIYASTISVEDYLDFFADMLTKAEEIIHISFGKDMGKSYLNALEAARCFGSVNVIDSGHIAGGMGIVVSEVARLLSEGGNTKEILEYTDEIGKAVQSKILFGKLENVRKNGYINSYVGFWLDFFNVHTIYTMKNSKIKFSGILIGNVSRAREKFIIKSLKSLRKKKIKHLWISYTDASVKQQEVIDEYIKSNIICDDIVMRKTSVTNACFAGQNSISISYLEK